MKALPKTVKIIILIAILPIVAATTFNAFKLYPIRNYCKNLALNSSYDSAVSKAREKDLFILARKAEKDHLMVFNHQSPFFRVACQCIFRQGRLVSKSIVSGD